ncbi:MAG: adenylate kinase family protein [Mycoplasma sp.]
MNIIIFGPPGSGKGTISQVLVNKHNYKHLALGDVFREHIKKQTKLGLEIKKIVESGNLVSDELVSQVAKEELVKIGRKQHLIIDGYPRTIGQGNALDIISKELNINWNFAVYLDVEREIIIDRIITRRVCSKCGSTYNIRYNPPKVANVCDICGGEVIQRTDDKREIITTRLDNYINETAPLVDFYKNKGIFRTISSHGDVNEIVNEILNLQLKNES